jgi:hydroxyethylthiazole kinase-like sugar kinase family protein
MTTSQEIQKQALLLPIGDRWQLVQTLLESLKRESHPSVKRGNLSRLRGIAKNSAGMDEIDAKEDYVNYLIKQASI